MPNWSNIASGAGSGAALGSWAGPWGTAIGGVVGGIAGALTPSPDEERQRRKAEYLKVLANLRQQELATGTAAINKQTTGQMSNVRQAAARRFASMGRGDAEAAINPAVSGVADIGSRTLENFQENTGRYFDQAQLAAEEGYANRPIEPSLTDTLLELGNASLNFKGTMDRANAMQQLNQTGAPTTEPNISPNDITGVTSMAPVNIQDYNPTNPAAPNANTILGGRRGFNWGDGRYGLNGNPYLPTNAIPNQRRVARTAPYVRNWQGFAD